MIPRYQTPEMAEIFSDEAKLARWTKVELEVLRVLSRRGVVPAEAYEEVSKALKGLDYRELARCQAEREREVQHDVIAFVECLERRAGEWGRFIHYGLTSYDVVDTAWALALKEAIQVILGELKGYAAALKDKALKYKRVPVIGRTHGVFAEPTSLGLKFLGFYTEAKRNEERLLWALETISYGKISGTVGNAAALGVEVEEEVLKALGLKPEPVSTQVVPLDRHAFVLQTLALLGASLERFATEIRGLARTEVGEWQEPFSAGQKGSSAMPHKRNPIVSERLCGIARLLRGYALAELESVALWHERDISNSSVERVAIPDAFHLAHYALKKARWLAENLVVNEARIAENLRKFGDFYRSQLLLLNLVQKGASRAEAYAWVKEVSQSGKPLKEAALGHPRVSELVSEREIDEILEFDYLREVERIFARALGEAE